MIHRTALWVLLGALPLAANAAGLNHKYQPKPQNYPVPADNVLWVATDGKSAAQGATGSREKPFSTLKEAADRSQNGTTIIMKSGIYREPHVFITRDDITLQAEPQGEVWLKGTEVVPADRWQKRRQPVENHERTELLPRLHHQCRPEKRRHGRLSRAGVYQ